MKSRRFNKPRLVVLGSGFGAFSLIKKIDTDGYDVNVVSPRNYFLFTPLLPSTTVGTIEFRSIIEPIRITNRHVRFYWAECDGIDPEKKIVICASSPDGNGFQLQYDSLVIAVGAVSQTFGIPGVFEYTKFLRDLQDARDIRRSIIDCFERASVPGLPERERKVLLSFVVVGGGPTGVEFAAELHDFLTEDLRRWYPDLVDEISLTLIEAAKGILTSFDKELTRYTMRKFKNQRINILMESPVKQVQESQIILQNDRTIPFGLAVWATGNGPTTLVESSNFPKNKSSRLLTDEYLRVVGSEDIYVIGDCAAIENRELPPTAQVAQQQGTYLARTLNRIRKKQTIRPFRYRHIGMLAYIGNKRALADLHSIKWKGLSTWIFWRTSYLTKLVSLRNKMLVLFDWFKAILFGRDISRF